MLYYIIKYFIIILGGIMKKNIISNILKIFLISICTIEIGIFIGCYILINTNFDKYKIEMIYR